MEQVRNPNPYVIPGFPPDKRPKLWERKRELTLVELFEDVVSVDIIIGVVSIVTGISKEDIISASRKKKKVQARHLTMYFCTKYVRELSLKHIAVLLRTGKSSRDHSSVITGRDVILDMICKKIRGTYADETLEYLTPIEQQLKHIIDESNRTYWQSRQR